jgi:hypothetical protein
MLAGPLVGSTIDIDQAFKTDTHIAKQSSWLTPLIGESEDPLAAAE